MCGMVIYILTSVKAEKLSSLPNIFFYKKCGGYENLP